MKYLVEFGSPIYRGNHYCEVRRMYEDFTEVVFQVRINPKTMMVERLEDTTVIYYWEDGWFEDALSEDEKNIIGR